MPAVIHVQLCALSLSVDHSQPQAESLGIGLGPEEKTVLGLGNTGWEERPAHGPTLEITGQNPHSVFEGNKELFL